MVKKLVGIIINVTIFIMILLTIYYSHNYLKTVNDKNKYEKKIIKEISLIETNSEKIKTLEYYQQYYSNKDIIGSLEIENTNINTLLVKGKNNEYYLNHSLNKEHDVVGSIFVDYRVNLDSKQINIYGHNSNYYDVVFKELENYVKEDYYYTHKYINLWDGNKTNKYEIFSVQIVDTDYEYYDVNPKNWNKHIGKLKTSIYNTGVEVLDEDDILTIQTCYYKPVNSFLIINSRKVI